MIKTKILAESDMQTLENAINSFIANKNVIDIKFQSVILHVVYMDGVPIKNTINDRALIIYEE